jgi:hypothetical protein
MIGILPPSSGLMSLGYIRRGMLSHISMGYIRRGMLSHISLGYIRCGMLSHKNLSSKVDSKFRLENEVLSLVFGPSFISQAE